MDRRFHAMLKLAQSFHASEKPPPCLFQVLLTLDILVYVSQYNVCTWSGGNHCVI